MPDWMYFVLAWLIPTAIYGHVAAWRRFKARKLPGGGS